MKTKLIGTYRNTIDSNRKWDQASCVLLSSFLYHVEWILSRIFYSSFDWSYWRKWPFFPSGMFSNQSYLHLVLLWEIDLSTKKTPFILLSDPTKSYLESFWSSVHQLLSSFDCLLMLLKLVCLFRPLLQVLLIVRASSCINYLFM